MEDGKVVAGSKVTYGGSDKELVVKCVSGNTVTLEGIPVPVSLEKLTVVNTGFEGEIEPGCAVLALKDALLDPVRCNGNFKWKGRVSREITEPFIFYNHYDLSWFYVYLDSWTVKRIFPDGFVAVQKTLKVDNKNRDYVAVIGPLDQLVKVPLQERP